MSLPGFTAEASLGPTVQVYRVRDDNGGAGAASLSPQANGADLLEDFEGFEDLGDDAELEEVGEALGDDVDEVDFDDDVAAEDEV
jgi:hypothetical protein